MDERQRIDKQLNDLQLAWMNGRMAGSEHRRRYSALMEQKLKLDPPPAVLKPEQMDLGEKTATLSFGGQTFMVRTSGVMGQGQWAMVNDMASAMDPEVLARLRSRIAEQAKTLANDWLGGWDMGAIRGPMGVNAAERIWAERNGVIVCECDNADCFNVLTITKAEYLHASGDEGWYRVTSPACAHGILGARLMERQPHYHVWAKMGY